MSTSDLLTFDRYQWDQQAEETPQAYQAFKLFLSLPAPRRYEDVRKQIDCSISNVRHWASVHNWTPRSREYDGYLSHIENQANIDLAKQKADEVAAAQWEEGTKNRQLGRRMREIFQEIVDRYDFEGTPVKNKDGTIKGYRGRTKFNPTAAIKFALAAAQLGQIGLQEMAEHVYAQDNFDPATATPDELKAWLVKHNVKVDQSSNVNVQVINNP